MIKRLKTLWALSGMEISSDVYKQVTLEIPSKDQKKHRRLATIIETETVNHFKDDKTDK